MTKWYEEIDARTPGAISSRVRMVRNWNQYVFPYRLPQKESIEMIRQLEVGLQDLGSLDGRQYEYVALSDLDELDRKAMRERRVFNATIAAKKTPMGLLLSENEDTGIVLNGTDHIRVQVLSPGLQLDQLWERCDQIDDYINARFPYAFDEKYGYLTSFPTNVGTAMRASAMVHLPTLSLGKKFSGLVAEMGRFGVTIRGVCGEGEDNYGSLYEIANQKTLGLSEKEILGLVNRTATQLLAQEDKVRKLALEKHYLECSDEAHRAYGLLKYARRISFKDAMNSLSQVMQGFGDGVLKTEGDCPIYRIMLDIQPAILRKISQKPLTRDELDEARADYIRGALPELQ